MDLSQVLRTFYLRLIFIPLMVIVTFIAQVSIARHDLVKAAVKGDLDTVSVLINNEGLDVNMRNENHNTALMGAAITGHFKIVEFLIHKGAKLDLQNLKGVTALMLAIHTNHKKIFRFLMESGANPNLSDKDGVTPLFLLSQKGYLEDIKFLVEHNNRVDIDAQMNNGGLSALMVAVDNEHTRVVKYLIESEANMDLQNEGGITALMRAVIRGDEEMVSILVDAGADVMNMQSKENLSALDYATFKENLEIMEILSSRTKGKVYCLRALLSKIIH